MTIIEHCLVELLKQAHTDRTVRNCLVGKRNIRKYLEKFNDLGYGGYTIAELLREDDDNPTRLRAA